MANSLNDWLAARVSSQIQTLSKPLSRDRVSLLDDIPFIKGQKVQILRFFTPQAALDANIQLNLSPTSKGSTPHRSLQDDGEQADDYPLWAVVGDRVHSVYALFSQSCVARFKR
jgi:hypothetical protein